MKIYDTSTMLTEADMPKSSTERLFVYNGIDCCVTAEVLEALLPQLDNTTASTYSFSRDLQGPILEMNMRGILIDKERRDEVVKSYRSDISRIAAQLNRILREGIGVNYTYSKNPWPSPAQLGNLFYDIMRIPEITKRSANGQRTRTVDRGALEKLEHYFYAEPVVRHILALRDLIKKVQFLTTEVSSDGRLRTSFNIAGTNTGRLSSYMSDLGDGTNLQNVENRLRSVFIADPGMKFCSIDLEQSDARVVGAIHHNLFNDSRYLDMCESGDLHTGVARLCWRNLPWSDNKYDNRAIADANFYRNFSYRDAAKRLGHGTNYQGQPDKMASATKIPINDIRRFQIDYMLAFPAFALWWNWVEQELRSTHSITTMLGRKRRFLGHPNDPETLRSAIAYEPQSVTADTIDRGLLAIWRCNKVHLLVQVHDSILFQFPESDEDEIVPDFIKLIEQQVELRGGRRFVIPAEAKTGFNWADYNAQKNPDPDALQKWYPGKPKQKRIRGGER